MGEDPAAPTTLNFELEERKCVLWVRYMDIWVSPQQKIFTASFAAGCNNVTWFWTTECEHNDGHDSQVMPVWGMGRAVPLFPLFPLAGMYPR